MAFPFEKLHAIEHLLSLKHFHLPKIPCSIPFYPPHPNHKYISKKSDEWAFKFMDPNMSAAERKYQVQCNYGLYTSMIIPFGSKRNAITSGKFSWLGLLLDDLVDDDVVPPEVVARSVDLFRGSISLDELPDVPVFKGCVDLLPELRDSMLPQTFARFLDECSVYATTISGINSVFTASTVEEFLLQRRFNIFIDPFLRLIEMVLGTALEDKDLQSQEYLNVRNALLDHIALVNEVLSFRRDFHRKKFYNLPVLLVLSDPNVHTVQMAMDLSCKMIQEKEREFLYHYDIIMKNVRTRGNHKFAKYLEAFPAIVSNNLLYHYVTARYNGVDNPLCVTGEPFHGLLSLENPEKTVIVA